MRRRISDGIFASPLPPSAPAGGRFTLTDENFAEVLQEREPVVVVFAVEWCGSCHMMALVIEELASDFQGQAKVGRLDIDHNPRIVAQ
jgi:thioredoxin 1